MKKSITLGLTGAPAAAVAAKASTVVSKMTNNPNFPAPQLALNSITAQIAALNAKLTEQKSARQTYQQKTVEMKNVRNQLINLLQVQSMYVQIASDGDEAKILSAGFDVRQQKSPVNSLPAPTGLLAQAGSDDGEINVSFNKVKGAKSYIIETSYDISSADNWETAVVVTKTRTTLELLESGKRIWVRVRAVNSAGPGSYSDPATKMIP